MKSNQEDLYCVNGSIDMAEILVDKHDYNKILPACPNCSCLEKCKNCLSDENITIKCIWYRWLKENFKTM